MPSQMFEILPTKVVLRLPLVETVQTNVHDATHVVHLCLAGLASFSHGVGGSIFRPDEADMVSHGEQQYCFEKMIQSCHPGTSASSGILVVRSPGIGEGFGPEKAEPDSHFVNACHL